MRILVVGFGELARELVGIIKTFPEYDPDTGVSIYHIFTNRNSLSYGSDLVVEIPDPHGDGYRTYKDGFQAVDKYATTVSNYKPWLLEEVSNGSVHVVLNCTSKNTESYTLISEILAASKSKLEIIPSNMVGVAKTISRLRELIGATESWQPVEFSAEFLLEAENLWLAAFTKMSEVHRSNKLKYIEAKGNPTGATELTGYSTFSAIPIFDRPIVERFIVNGEREDLYPRAISLDADHDCTVIQHPMLKDFFGWHHTEYLACKEFIDPDLQIESAQYIKYLSDDSTHVDVPDSDYVIEYVHSGAMTVTSNDGSSSIILRSNTDQSSFSYRPRINAPAKFKVHAGLETIVFTYKRVSDAS